MWAIRSVVHLHVAMENIISFFINNKIQARRSSDKAGAFTYRAERKPALCLDFLASGGGSRRQLLAGNFPRGFSYVFTNVDTNMIVYVLEVTQCSHTDLPHPCSSVSRTGWCHQAHHVGPYKPVFSPA